ncbi:MAG: outer membrane protein assembly factor BamC [Vibrionaceae bacterium]
MRSFVKLGLAAAIAITTGCSSSKNQQAEGGFDYLDSAPLRAWHALPDQNLPPVATYAIPSANYAGDVGKKVDISSPLQPLELIPGARLVANDQELQIRIADQNTAQKLLDMLDGMQKDHSLPVRKQLADGIETDWIVVNKEQKTKARYVIQKLASYQGLRVSLLELAGKDEQSLKISPLRRERYTAQMANRLMTRYDLAIREEARLKALQQQRDILISMGVDRGGNAVIIARASYDVFWNVLPKMLTQMGFEIKDRNRSQAVIEANYIEPSDEFWQSIGQEKLNLKKQKYKIQLGDLGNRTSINVLNSADKPIEQEQLVSLSLVLGKTLEKMNVAAPQ